MSPRALLFAAALALPISEAAAEPPAPSPSKGTSAKKGVPEGRFTSLYDNGRVAVVADFKAGVLQRASGYLPDGTPWPAGAKVVPCYEGSPCIDLFRRIDFEKLPPLRAPSCPESASGKFTALPRTSFHPVLTGAMQAWPPNRGGEIPGPSPSCIRGIRLACAPDLDGIPGREVLAEISYRLLLYGETDCATTDIEKAWDMIAIVALSPPQAGRPTWSPLGVVGYPQCNADVCPSHDTFTGFLLLPSGETGVRVRSNLTDGDCLYEAYDEIRTLSGRVFTTLAAKVAQACK